MGRAAPSRAAGTEPPRRRRPRRPSFTALGFLAVLGLLLGSGTTAGWGPRWAAARGVGARRDRAGGRALRTRAARADGRVASGVCLGPLSASRGQRAGGAPCGAGACGWEGWCGAGGGGSEARQRRALRRPAPGRGEPPFLSASGRATVCLADRDLGRRWKVPGALQVPAKVVCVFTSEVI